MFFREGRRGRALSMMPVSTQFALIGVRMVPGGVWQDVVLDRKQMASLAYAIRKSLSRAVNPKRKTRRRS